MPGSGGSITYKSLVISLIGVVIAMLGFFGGRALVKLDDLQMAVITLQATKAVEDRDQTALSDTVRLLSAQVQFLTQWMEDTFGQPKPKSKPQFGHDD